MAKNTLLITSCVSRAFQVTTNRLVQPTSVTLDNMADAAAEKPAEKGDIVGDAEEEEDGEEIYEVEKIVGMCQTKVRGHISNISHEIDQGKTLLSTFSHQSSANAP